LSVPEIFETGAAKSIVQDFGQIIARPDRLVPVPYKSPGSSEHGIIGFYPLSVQFPANANSDVPGFLYLICGSILSLSLSKRTPIEIFSRQGYF
jgi:hypothetical protein